MNRIFALLAIVCAAAVAVPAASEGGLFCRAKANHCAVPAAEVCYAAPAPVCCPAPAPICAPEPCCLTRPRLLRRALRHCTPPTPVCAPAPAPIYAPAYAPISAPCCGSTGYNRPVPYGYGVAVSGPHWF